MHAAGRHYGGDRMVAAGGGRRVLLHSTSCARPAPAAYVRLQRPLLRGALSTSTRKQAWHRRRQRRHQPQVRCAGTTAASAIGPTHGGSVLCWQALAPLICTACSSGTWLIRMCRPALPCPPLPCSGPGLQHVPGAWHMAQRWPGLSVTVVTCTADSGTRQVATPLASAC